MANDNSDIEKDDEIIRNPEDFAQILRFFEKESRVHQNDNSVEWMISALKTQLPGVDHEELEKFTKDLRKFQKITLDEKESLSKAMQNGRSKYNWFASRMVSVEAGSSVGPVMAHQYMEGLNKALGEANRAMAKTVLNKDGSVNMGRGLHGFLFEQSHTQTYNMSKAARMEADFSARVPDSPHGYTHHGVDIAIDNVETGQKMSHKYNAKDYKTSSASGRAAHADGGHPGQTILVPDGQDAKIKGAVNQIGHPGEGASSNPMTYEKSVELKNQAQSGDFDHLLDWNEYKTRDLAVGIAKNAACAGVMGAGMSACFEVASKVVNGEQVEAEDVALAAAKGGASAALFDATSCAIKVGVEKDLIPLIPKGTSASTIANVAFVVVEDVKILSQMADGELTLKEGLEELEATTISCAAGLVVAEGVGGLVGGAIGGPIGLVAGAVVGAVAYTATAAVGRAVIKGAQMVRDAACSVVGSIVEGACSLASAACDFVSDAWDAVTGGCYITTAVCEAHNKPDDCYELTLLRNFRDGWLVNQSDGKRLVEQYYATAPGIVRYIEGLPNRGEIYDVLKKKFIDPCIAFIEKGMFENCKTCYVEMVLKLDDMKKNCKKIIV